MCFSVCGVQVPSGHPHSVQQWRLSEGICGHQTSLRGSLHPPLPESEEWEYRSVPCVLHSRSCPSQFKSLRTRSTSDVTSSMTDSGRRCVCVCNSLSFIIYSLSLPLSSTRSFLSLPFSPLPLSHYSVDAERAGSVCGKEWNCAGSLGRGIQRRMQILELLRRTTSVELPFNVRLRRLWQVKVGPEYSG